MHILAFERTAAGMGLELVAFSLAVAVIMGIMPSFIRTQFAGTA